MTDKEYIKVQGNKTLAGTVRASGAKNSALKLLAASIIADGVTTLHNIPDISDVGVMIEVLEFLGAKVERNSHTVIVDARDLYVWQTPYSLVSKMRASISILGPLIARFGKAKVAMPGGCQIGARKIDMHLVGLHMLGVEFRNDHGSIIASCDGGIHGANISLDFPSVGATENALMAAIVAKGETIIENAACEPEIVDLANMLNEMGAKITGQGTPQIVIVGVSPDEIHSCTHTCIGDRIETGTFLVGGALTKGPLTVEGINPKTMQVVISKLKNFGCECTEGPSSITLYREKELVANDIQTLPYPGFPTDLQAQFMLLANYANGISIITENVFENRFMFASELLRMGADITIDDQHAVIHGPQNLSGAPVKSTDLRAGAALVLAGIMAEGYTNVYNIHHIDRGYDNYVGKLQSLGADISRMRE